MIGTGIAAAIALMGQSVPPTPSAPQTTDGAVSEDIVVTGLRDIEAKDSAVTTGTLGSQRTGDAVGSRRIFDLARRWAACAAAPRDETRRQWLRKALDTRTNSTVQAFAMSRLAQLNMECAPDAGRAVGGAVTDPYYDRGALVIETLKSVEPPITLTKAQTGDPVVQARFNRRETPLSKFRLPVDQHYFETAVCFVRLQPELSVRLALTDQPLDSVRRLEAAIVNRARLCVGNARKVYFDGVQFRFYIADAVYRWVAAARDARTLVPDAE